MRITLSIFVFCIIGCGGHVRGPSDSNDDQPKTPKDTHCALAQLPEELPIGQTAQSIARYYQGPLFKASHDQKPQVSDVRQAGFNVCYFYAFLSSLVVRNPSLIMQNIKKVKDGYEVNVFDPQSQNPCVFVSDRQLAIFRYNGRVQTDVLWPEILLAVWVSYLGKSDLKMAEDIEFEKTGSDPDRGRQELRAGQTIDMDLVRKDMFQYFLNKTGKVRRIKPRVGDVLTPLFPQNAAELLTFVDACQHADCIMYAYVAPGGEVPGPKTPHGLPSGLFDHHCYGITSVDNAGGAISLRNPHGGLGARAVSYRADGSMAPSIQINEHFLLRGQDFFNQFYTLQFSAF